MPYSVPTAPPASLSASSPPSYARSTSSHPAPTRNFSNETGPGAFAALGSLPRRGTSLTGNPLATSATAKRFHFKSSPEASSSESSDDDDDIGHNSLPTFNQPMKIHDPHDHDNKPYYLTPLKLRVNRLGSPSFNGVPFPRSSPLSSPTLGSPLPSPTRTPSGLLSPLSLNSPTSEIPSLPIASNDTANPQLPISASNPIYSPYKYPAQDGTALPLPLRPSPTRSTSSPHILASDGRPLKSSLKSSSSTSSIHSHPHGPHFAVHHAHSSHQRASSAPSTPGFGLLGDNSTPSSPNSSATASAPGSGTSSPTTPKSVHFPSLPTHLERVRIFHKSAKPASLLTARVQGEETETETETDRGSDWDYAYRGNMARSTHTSFPFPKIGTSPLSSSSSVWPPSAAAVASVYRKGNMKLELDMTGYPVPDPSSIPPQPGTNILLESISLSSSVPEDKMHLQGAFIVRNLAYQKDVAVRFTVDDWSTVSEIKANWVGNFPSPFLTQRSSLKDTDSWDRFAFCINLSDYTPASLPSKVIYFVARYTLPGKEYWDNCGGRNWRVKFKLTKVNQESQHPADLSTVSLSKSAPLPNAVDSSPTVSPPVTLKEIAASSPSSQSDLQPSSSSPVSVVNPPPRRTEAVAQATAHRLRRFSLSNYVAPGVSPPSLNPTQTEEKGSPDVAQKSNLTPDTQSEIAASVQPAPRGQLSIVTTPSNATTPPGSSPTESKSSSPQTTSSSSLSTPPGEANSESLYNWFVQQWCFAGMPSSGLPDQGWKHRGEHVPDISKGNLGLEIGG
ncbi:putative phosphatase regulatory subunit-domain-containing protein [Lentinula aciculospora]|uniref:Phosphatase regulatory subunit-domain-containing protein n=1 Tax=Lentinula aciculospora TaxID=153920 RepID=A0A9W9DHG4_9AGAR|nr:putative phosphatase regulatory subunit-domain-containing protein [Lentinula aciculospora]